MNRQEAIQQQIDEIMDMFDFHDCVKIMDLMKSTGRACPSDYFDGNNCLEWKLRESARHVLKQAAKYGYCATGYFEAHCFEEEDTEGPWVKLSLNFGIHWLNEGITYEKTTTTNSDS